MRNADRILLFICLLCTPAITHAAPAQPTPAQASAFTGRVIAVADGDTVTVLTQDKQQVRIRLYGIDCPESKQAFGNRARQATANAVHGKDVIVRPMDKDRYGRLVGIVSAMAGDGEAHYKANASLRDQIFESDQT